MLFDKIRYLSKGADVFVLAGSLPRDVPADLYERLLRELRRDGMITAVDASGPALRAALTAEPSVVSPNVREAEEIVGHEFGDEDDMVAAAETLTQMGAGGGDHPPRGRLRRAHPRTEGKRGRTYRARLPRRTDIVSTVGSGDALLAGYLSARYGHQPPEARAGAGRGLRRRQHPALRRRRLRPVRRRVADAAGRDRRRRITRCFARAGDGGRRPTLHSSRSFLVSTDRHPDEVTDPGPAAAGLGLFVCGCGSDGRGGGR